VLPSTNDTEDSQDNSTKPVHENPNLTEFDVDSWRDVLSDNSINVSLYEESDDKGSGLHSIPPIAANKASLRRMEIIEAAKAYWPKREIVTTNVAISFQKIGQSDRQNHYHPRQTTSELQLEVNVVVCPISALKVSPGGSESEGDHHSDEDQHQFSVEEKPAILELVRMVNDVPLLDGAEAQSCGVVHGLDNKMVWGSFGLDIRRKTVYNSQNCDSVPQRCKWTPTFELQDHKQVAAYLQKDSNHKQLRSLMEDDEEESEDKENNLEECNHKDSRARKRTRKPKLRHKQDLLPAGLRLHEVLVVVRIRAAPSSLPLPTLSKASSGYYQPGKVSSEKFQSPQ
jgi:hypothetical protein